MFTLIILVAFFTLIALGPIALTIAVLSSRYFYYSISIFFIISYDASFHIIKMFVCQIGGFLEITRIGHVAYRADRLR